MTLFLYRKFHCDQNSLNISTILNNRRNDRIVPYEGKNYNKITETLFDKQMYNYSNRINLYSGNRNTSQIFNVYESDKLIFIETQIICGVKKKNRLFTAQKQKYD